MLFSDYYSLSLLIAQPFRGSKFGCIGEGGDARQFLSLQKLQAGPAPCTDMADFLGLPKLLSTCGSVSTTWRQITTL